MDKLKNGYEYEIYILNIIKTKYKSCYLWKDIPENIVPCNFYINNKICDDIGCDIVGINHDNSIDYIQCKNYSTTGNENTISIYDLAGFYNFLAENRKITNAYVYYSGKLSRQILCRNNDIKYICIPYIKNLNKNNIIIPKTYQIDAYNTLKDVNRGILSMPCGTGKTFVSFLLSIDYKNIFILTPLISTTEQILNHFKNYYSNNNIDIDNNINNPVNYTLINCKAERNIENINITPYKNIFASTYDSVDILIKILEKTNQNENLFIIDEFHNLSFDMINNNNNNMNKILTSNNKIIFVSATPLNIDNHKNIFGNIKYELTWKTAIDNKYICDYNFYYPNNDKIITRINHLKIDKNLIEKTILINKAYFLLESIKLTNIKKCIVYLKTIDESISFVKILKTLNIYFDFNLKINQITYDTIKSKRIEYLNRFQYDDTCINILCNVHILDEGIDIPNCDSVFLTHPNNNIINIIQRISRANRLNTSNVNKIARIFIWGKNKIKIENIMKNISKTFVIKYGKEINTFVNTLHEQQIKDEESVKQIEKNEETNINYKDDDNKIINDNSVKNYICNYCEYNTNIYNCFIKHLNTDKHKKKLINFKIIEKFIQK
jgi:superfamily II DNA or RNA helicase